MRDYCNRSLKDVLQWLAHAARNERIEIILRPRPSATMEEFQAFVGGILPEIPPHLHILQQGSIREWILASDVILSSHSTSLIEGAVAGKPVFIVEPDPMPAALKVEWHDRLAHLKTCDEVHQVCAGKIDEGDTRLKDWAGETMMRYGDSIRNIAQFVRRLLSGEVDAPPPPSREVATPTLKWIPSARLWSIYRRVKQGLRLKKTGGIEPEFVKDVVSQDEINSRIQRWSRRFAIHG
jgi:hypothetical protein